jgi:LPXTG-site transpeptidase (sortase) family protein
MAGFPRIPLKRINTLLFVLIVCINGYIIAAPVWPRVSFWWREHHTDQRTELSRALSGGNITKNDPKGTQPNSLIIPAMLLNQPTLEGPEQDWFNLLKEGVWHWPHSSTPDKGGNTVLLAHRFSYTGPHGAFYYLDKLHTGDTIGVVWNGKTYTYKVTSSRIVPPTETSVQDNTPDSRLTLFTCAPLWHPVNRLVVVAELQGVSK